MTEITSMCSACAAGLYEECENPERIVSVDPGVERGSLIEWIIPCFYRFMNSQGIVPDTSKGIIGRPPSDPDQVTDPTSTGRKRAKMLAPILTGQLCAWSGLRHAGGGVVPIVGCDGNQMIEKKGGDDLYRQGDRHHGPDKNTLNNSVGVNLHSICVDCHHRWHALNDPYYSKQGRGAADMPFVPVEAYYPHDATTSSSEDDRLLAEAWWQESPFDRGPYPVAPGPDARRILPLPGDPGTLEPADNPFAEEEIGDSRE